MKPIILFIAGSIHREGNSEIALKEAERGVKTKDVDTDWIILNEYFYEDGTQKEYLSDLIEKVQRADGIIWGSPVYFGAWSSLAQNFYEYLKENNVSLFPKVIGFVVVGAKRNGGQETTITFASWDLMELGACVVNDGYPVSQFGGTCVGGLIGGVNNDKEGLGMCFNTGKRVAETAMILKNGEITDKPIKIINWPPKEGKFARCRACAECPSKELFEKDEDYKCRYSDDDLYKLHQEIIEAEGIIPQKYDLKFFERTRYLRRDNYRLTYHVVLMPEPKWIPLFIKQNSILCRMNFEKYVKLISTGRKKLTLEKQIYEPIGHEINPYIKS